VPWISECGDAFGYEDVMTTHFASATRANPPMNTDHPQAGFARPCRARYRDR